MLKRILLSPPHLGNQEQKFVKEAFDTNWIAPVGPHLDAFEQEFSKVVGSGYAAAVSSGTAALHLALRLVGVEAGDEIFCSTFTFVGSVNPIIYLGAKPVFIDSDRTSWNMDPFLLKKALEQRARVGKLPKAVIVVHLYGQSADLDPILEICDPYEIPVIEDAAEALGSTYKGKAVGSLGKTGIFSFNGNKIITTSGGGMLVSNDQKLINQARFFATQARDPAPFYQHSQIGYNYRLSNVLAGIGRGQLLVLPERVAARRDNFEHYQQALGQIPGIEFMPEADFGRSNRWLTVILINSEIFGAKPEEVIQALAEQQIESRRAWKPMHLQPLFADCECFGGKVSEDFFHRGLCLPSGSSLTFDDRQRVIDIIKRISPTK